MNTFQTSLFVHSIEHKTVGDKQTPLAIIRGAARNAGDMENGKRKDGWINVEAWGQNAEFIQKFVKEKSAIEVYGTWYVHQWVDEQTGKNREIIKWVADRVSFAPVSRAEGDAPSGDYVPDGAGVDTTTGSGGGTPAAAAPTRDPFAI